MADVVHNPVCRLPPQVLRLSSTTAIDDTPRAALMQWAEARHNWGESHMGQAVRLGICPSATTQRKDTIARRARQFWGDEVLAGVQMQPLWRRRWGGGEDTAEAA